MSSFVPLASLEDSTPRTAARGRVALVALGCAKNLVDAEQMLGALAADGYALVPDTGSAEVVIVNTCAFIAAAREEAIREIRAASRLKRSGACEVLVVSGCFAQKEPEQIRALCPEVDAVVGVSEFPQIAGIVAAARPDGQAAQVAVSVPQMPYQEYLPRRRATPPWTAYVKIAEGCDCACTFCTIPSIRGSFRSRSEEAVLAEVRALAADGVREVNLIAEDTTHYGFDRTGRRQLAGLLYRLGEVEGLLWVRLLYCYPTKVDDGLTRAIAEVPVVAKYLDLPLQHAHDGLLKAMGRAGRREGYLRRIAALREAAPEICLRSTFIVGFPGEHREELEALESFLDEADLDRVGFFAYSPEPGTPAAELPGRVPAGVAQARIARLAERQAAISLRKNEGLVGKTLKVLVEQVTPGGGVGRSYRDAPEIDGVVWVAGSVSAGEVAAVLITAADTHDLHGRTAAGQE
ncbi:MAG: 30S ribosomal protein S12 methylthiotransferase RimO [Armatimonadetes bacterium]|nr:30S ribosomal protein S12 methylthiotransferase RimO [Armatimonadota bacterium]